jgi:hypothetical protein
LCVVFLKYQKEKKLPMMPPLPLLLLGADFPSPCFSHFSLFFLFIPPVCGVVGFPATGLHVVGRPTEQQRTGDGKASYTPLAEKSQRPMFIDGIDPECGFTIAFPEIWVLR